MLTLPADEVAELLEGGDTRWIHRAAHDLMGVDPRARSPTAGMPRGRSLYGSVPEQLEDETSFVRQLQAILACAATTASPRAAGRHPRGLPQSACWSSSTNSPSPDSSS